MKIGIFFRSTASFLVVLFLLGASNVFAILKLVELNTFILNSQTVDLRMLNAEKKLVDSFFSQRRYEQKYLLTKDAVLYDQFLAAERDFKRFLDEAASIPISPVQKEAVARIRAYHQRYRALVDKEVTYLKENRGYDQDRYKEEKGKASDAILDELEMLEHYPGDDVMSKTKMAAEAGISARSVAITSLLVTVLLAILLSLLFTRSITRPLMELVSKTREISTGTFTCDLDLSAPPEIRELAEAFNSMCDKLKEVDKMKSDFFSMISHELRTPLTTIKEGTSLLLEGQAGSMTEKQGKLLAIISKESNRLTTLVNSILDLSKMEAGMMTYTFGQENIIPLIDQAMTGIMPYAEAKKIRLHKQIPVDIPPWRMDQERILEVLRNLIGNAVKFTPEGGMITIAVHPVSDGLQVSVSDTGPGILKENLAVIFEKYKSSDPKRGTGLGLAMVKHIVAAHGGKVWAESEPGKGSTFIFVLPS